MTDDARSYRPVDKRLGGGGFEETGLLLSPPRRTGDGFYEAVVRTPEGILVEITA